MISGGTWSGGSVAVQSEPVTPTPALTIAPADTSGPAPTDSVPTPFVIIATAPAPEIAVVPTGRSSSAQPTLALTDFDTRGLRVEMLALFTAGNAGDQPALYSAARSRWPESGSLVAGEIGIGPEGTPIVRAVYLEDSNGLRLNDAGELALKVYFGEDGTGNDLTVSVQTTDGKTSFPVANNVSSSGDNYIRFNLPPGGKEIVGNINPGDHFILALTRPATRAISGSAPTPTSVYTPPPTLTAPPTTEVPPPTPRLTPAQRLYPNATHSIVNAFHAAKRCACRAATRGI